MTIRAYVHAAQTVMHAEAILENMRLKGMFPARAVTQPNPVTLADRVRAALGVVPLRYRDLIKKVNQSGPEVGRINSTLDSLRQQGEAVRTADGWRLSRGLCQ